MAARADNGMDPYTVLGISARAVRKKEDLYKLRHRCKHLIDGYLVKRQGSNARRVKWAFDQIKLKMSRDAQPQASEPQADGRGAAAPEAAPAPGPVPGPAAEGPGEPPADRFDAIRSKAAARRERAAAGEEDPDDAKRRETIREKLAMKRMLKQVPVLKEEDCRQRAAELVMAAFPGPAARASLACPASGQRLRLPARGVACRHLQCFDLEHHLGSKASRCPVCSLELQSPGELRSDAYVSKILREAGEKVKEVTFDKNGAWAAFRERPTVAKAPVPLAEPHSASPHAAVRCSTAKVRPAAEGPPTGERQVAATAVPEAPAAKPGKPPKPKPPEPLKPKPPEPKPPPTPEQLREEAEREEKRQRAKRYHTLRAEELVDPMDEANYVVVELATSNMGVSFRPNPSVIGGTHVEALDAHGMAARHGGLKAGDQLVGIGDKLVIGKDIDACIDMIVADDRGMAKLTVFRGTASGLYGKGGASAEWLEGLMARVRENRVEVTPPAPEPEPPSPDPDPEPEPTPPPEKRRKNHRLSISSEESGSSEVEADDFSLDLSEDSDGGASQSTSRTELPQRLVVLVVGAGLEADLQACVEALPQPPADGAPERLPAEPRALARAVLKACTNGNAEAWAAMGEEDQAAWRTAARKRLVRAACERAENLEAVRRQQLQEQLREQQASSLAAVAAAAASRQGAKAEEQDHPLADGPSGDELLLQVQPDKAIKFDRNRTSQLTLRNKSSGYVAYRVRTSAPRFIFVQPCAGTLTPGEHVSLQVCSSEGRFGGSELKFLIQAVAAPDAGSMERERWAVIDSEAIQEWNLVGRL